MKDLAFAAFASAVFAVVSAMVLDSWIDGARYGVTALAAVVAVIAFVDLCERRLARS